MSASSYIRVGKITVSQYRAEVNFEVSDNLKHIFRKDNSFWVEYSDDISQVPESVLVVPFLCNVLPIAWLTDSVLSVPKLDRHFYESIPDILKGYKELSPMLNFRGGVEVGEIVDHVWAPSEKVAAFFSGGVDAFSTLIAHMEERPRLMTVWGADLKLNDEVGWNVVKSHVEETVQQFNLEKPLYIKTNFRTFFDDKPLGEIVKECGSGWWYAYQCGMGLIGLSAPVAYLEHWRMVYIASSYPEGVKIICASDPSIDNMIHFCNVNVLHDQRDYDRQMKITSIVDLARKGGQKVQPRVCWMTRGGRNCCKCEKCLRTIYGFLAEGAVPGEYGFSQWEKPVAASYDIIKRTCMFEPLRRKQWIIIQDRFRKTQAFRGDSRIDWIYDVDFQSEPTVKDKIRNALLSMGFIRNLKRHLSKLSAKK